MAWPEGSARMRSRMAPFSSTLPVEMPSAVGVPSTVAVPSARHGPVSARAEISASIASTLWMRPAEAWISVTSPSVTVSLSSAI